MHDISLYEKIPHEQFPIRILVYNNNGYDFPQHWHEHTELHYFFKGSGRLYYGDSDYTLQEGELAVINGNELHRGLGGSCDYICLIIPPDFFEQNHSIFEKIVRDEYVSSLIEKIYACYCSQDSVDTIELKGLSYFLVAHLIRNHTVKHLGETVYSGHVNRLNRVNEVIKYMSNNYDKPLSTKTLSELSHLSEGYFCQLFKEVTGKTAMDYLNRMRVNKAEKLLLNTEMTVTEIAFHCGFDDSNYFSRMYKKIKGKSPQSVRSDAKNNKEQL